MLVTMTQAEYARHKGMSRQRVGQLVSVGRIPLTDSGRVDVAAADASLAGAGASPTEMAASSADLNPPQSAPSGGGMRFAASESAALTKARTATEVYTARLRQIEFEKQTGKLLQVGDVTAAMERCAETIVRDLDQLVSHADDLAAALSRGGVAALREELRRVVRSLRATVSSSMTLLAADDGEDQTEAESS